MFKMDLQVDGGKECVRELHELDKAVRGRISQRAVSAAVAVFVEPIRQKAPRRSGDLASSVASRIRYYVRSGRVLAFAGPSYPQGAHGSIIEGGTTSRFTAKGYYRGSGPAMPFAGPAFAENVGQAESVLVSELRSGIEAEASR